MKTIEIHSIKAIKLGTILKSGNKNYKVIGNTQTIIVELQEVESTKCTECGEDYEPSHSDERCPNCGNHQFIN